MTSIFSNFDNLFLRLPLTHSEFLWIIWYIWKAKNDKIYKNLDRDPRETLQVADAEAKLWISAQHDFHLEERHISIPDGAQIPLEGPWCFVNGSWKTEDSSPGLGWYYSHIAAEEIQMVAMNLRHNLSPLHTELEALI